MLRSLQLRVNRRTKTDRPPDPRRAGHQRRPGRRSCRRWRGGRRRSRKRLTFSPRDETNELSQARDLADNFGSVDAGCAARRTVADRRVVSCCCASQRASTPPVLPTSTPRDRPTKSAASLMRWLTQHGFNNEKTASQIAALWSAGGGAGAWPRVVRPADQVILPGRSGHAAVRRGMRVPAQPLKAFRRPTFSTTTNRTSSTRCTCGCFTPGP